MTISQVQTDNSLLSGKMQSRIFLIGFMGSGKSTVGKVLAELLDYPFVDLDEQIVLHENRSITTIFETDGEGYFRDCESAALNRTCDKKKFICEQIRVFYIVTKFKLSFA